MCLHCRTERWGTGQGENLSHQWTAGNPGAETPTSSPPCKTHTAVNQLGEGAVGAPAAPFFLQLWYGSQEVVEGAGAPGALPGTGILELHVPLLSSVCSRGRGVRAQPVGHRGRAGDTSLQVFVLKRVNEDHLRASFIKTLLKCSENRLLVRETDWFSHSQRMHNALPFCCLKLSWRKVLPCSPSFGFKAEVGNFNYVKYSPTTLNKYMKYLQLNLLEVFDRSES